MPWKRPLNLIGGCSILISVAPSNFALDRQTDKSLSPQKLEALIFMETLPIKINTEADNDKWVEVAGALIKKRNLTAEETVYLDRLVDLIEAFEDVAYPMGYPI